MHCSEKNKDNMMKARSKDYRGDQKRKVISLLVNACVKIEEVIDHVMILKRKKQPNIND